MLREDSADSPRTGPSAKIRPFVNPSIDRGAAFQKKCILASTGSLLSCSLWQLVI